MKYITILLFTFLLIIWGCGKGENRNTGIGSESKTETGKIQTNKESTISEALEKQKKSDGIKLLKFEKGSIPEECSYKGNIITDSRWIDDNGENILIISNTPIKNINEDEREQYFYANCYIKSDDKYKLLWQIQDHTVSHCDISADYIPGTLEVLDLNDDGIGENAFIYKLDDRCDVSPLPIKLMMHSGSKKLVIRGTTRVDAGDGEKVGGEKKFDATFNSLPESFKNYASDKWDNFMKNYKNP